MKGIFDAYELWTLAQRVLNWIVDWSIGHDFTVYPVGIISPTDCNQVQKNKVVTNPHVPHMFR